MTGPPFLKRSGNLAWKCHEKLKQPWPARPQGTVALRTPRSLPGPLYVKPAIGLRLALPERGTAKAGGNRCGMIAGRHAGLVVREADYDPPSMECNTVPMADTSSEVISRRLSKVPRNSSRRSM